jgi:flagellar biosynthesis protein FliQ
MQVVWWVIRIFVGILLFAPLLVGLDLIIGLLMGVEHGVLQLYDAWLFFVTRIVYWLGGTALLAKWLVGIWAFSSLGIGFARTVFRE